MAMRKRGGVKPVVMWGWTNSRGEPVHASVYQSNYLSADWFGGTRIRVVVTPAKKPAKCNCNRVGLTTSDCGMFMDRCTNPKCKRAVKPAKKGRKP